MKNLTKSKALLWAIGLSAAFWLVAAFVPTVLLIDTLNGMFLGIAVAVILIYLPLVWHTIGSKTFDRAGQLSIGISLLWLSITMSRGWSAIYRYLGSPTYLLNSPIIAFFIFIACIGGGLFVTSPGYYPPPPIPFGGYNRRLLAVFAFAGAAIAVFLHYEQ